MNHRSIPMTLALVAALAVAGCQKKTDNGGAAGTTATKAPAKIDKSQPVRIAYVEWSSAVASANVVKDVLESKLGYKVRLIPVSAAAMWQAVAVGDADALLSAWLPTTHAAYYKRFHDPGRRPGPEPHRYQDRPGGPRLRHHRLHHPARSQQGEVRREDHRHRSRRRDHGQDREGPEGLRPQGLQPGLRVGRHHGRGPRRRHPEQEVDGGHRVDAPLDVRPVEAEVPPGPQEGLRRGRDHPHRGQAGARGDAPRALPLPRRLPLDRRRDELGHRRQPQEGRPEGQRQGLRRRPSEAGRRLGRRRRGQGAREGRRRREHRHPRCGTTAGAGGK